MAEQLFPVFDVPGTDAGDDTFDMEYRRSVKWDPQAGDFVCDRAGNMVACDGREAFMIWCYKMVQTERYDHMAYTPQVCGCDLGSELEEARKESDHDITQSMVRRTITEALMVNPRTEYVRNFTFLWEGDSLHVSFDVKGTGWDETFRITL